MEQVKMVRGSEEVIIAVDPGTVKCGVAILDYSGSLVEGFSVNRSSYIQQFKEVLKLRSPLKCIVGNGTSSKALIAEIQEKCSISVVVIDEFGSTLQARKLWAESEWSTGIYKYVPFIIKTLFEPSSLDSYAAWALGLRFLKQKNRSVI